MKLYYLLEKEKEIKYPKELEQWDFSMFGDKTAGIYMDDYVDEYYAGNTSVISYGDVVDLWLDIGVNVLHIKGWIKEHYPEDMEYFYADVILNDDEWKVVKGVGLS